MCRRSLVSPEQPVLCIPVTLLRDAYSERKGTGRHRRKLVCMQQTTPWC